MNRFDKLTIKKLVIFTAILGLLASGIFNVAQAANQVPVWGIFSPASSYIAIVGETLKFTVIASDPDGDRLTYSVSNLPANASFGNEIFAWTPIRGQEGIRIVTFRASDGTSSSEKEVRITVYGDGSFASNNASNSGNANTTPAPTQPVTNTVYVPIDKPVPYFVNRVVEIPEKLKIHNLRVSSDKKGNVIISWETNKLSRDRVIYDTVSQKEKTQDFTYANATLESVQPTIAHSVVLPPLEPNTSYFLRAVAKTDTEIAASDELIVIQLPDRSLNVIGLTALFSDTFDFLAAHPVISALILTALFFAAAIYWRKRKAAVL